VNGAIAGIDALLRVDGLENADDVQKKPGATLNITVKASTGEVITGGEPPHLYDVVNSALQDGKPHSTQEVLEIAQTRGAKLGVHPLRNVAGTLVGLARGAKVKRLDDGRFQKVAD
jgi:hypothetical protein